MRPNIASSTHHPRTVGTVRTERGKGGKEADYAHPILPKRNAVIAYTYFKYSFDSSDLLSFPFFVIVLLLKEEIFDSL
jgi:hypothetical protein